MALAAIVENIEDLPEVVREHYIQRGNKWVLETEGDEAKLRLNRDLADERKKRQELEKSLQRFGQTTPEEVEALRVRRRMEDAEEETATQRVQRLRDEMDRTKRDSDLTIREKDAEVVHIKAELLKERIGARIRTAAQARGFEAGAQEDAVLLGMTVFKEDEAGKVAAFDANGERLLGKSGDDLTYDEWLEQRRADRRHWFGGQASTGNQGGGATHQGGGTTTQSRARPKNRSGMSPSEKAACIGELGIEGFMELPD